MNIVMSDGCATRYIHGVSSSAYRKDDGVEEDGHQAMRNFCKVQLDKPECAFYSTHKTDGGATGNVRYPLYCLYFFNERTKDSGGGYGEAFADFIESHGLGNVTRSPESWNEATHPGSKHYNKGYIYIPDCAAVVKWWKDGGKMAPTHKKVDDKWVPIDTKEEDLEAVVKTAKEKIVARIKKVVRRKKAIKKEA